MKTAIIIIAIIALLVLAVKIFSQKTDAPPTKSNGGLSPFQTLPISMETVVDIRPSYGTLILADTGIISDRDHGLHPTHVYIPYKVITSVTYEECQSRFGSAYTIVTLQADPNHPEIKRINVEGGAPKTAADIKDLMELENGLLVLESATDEQLETLQKTLSDHEISFRKVDCNPL